MIKTRLGAMIGGAFWTPGATILGSSSKNLSQLIKSLFSLGEQGFAYDPNDLSTLYQDAAGVIPVTAAGQPVGMILDKSKGLVLGHNIATVTTTTIGDEVAGADYKLKKIADLVVDRWYMFSMTVAEYTGTLDVGVILAVFPLLPYPNLSRTSNGVISFISKAGSNAFNIYRRVSNSAVFTNISVKEVLGNHAYQTQSAMRPLLVANPQRLDYDAVDDNLITNLPTQLTGCTVIRSVPNVGTQILTNQTIPTPYNDNIDHCGLIVINRDLTASETSQITKLFNKAAGV